MRDITAERVEFSSLAVRAPCPSFPYRRSALTRWVGRSLGRRMLSVLAVSTAPWNMNDCGPLVSKFESSTLIRR